MEVLLHFVKGIGVGGQYDTVDNSIDTGRRTYFCIILVSKQAFKI